MSLRSQMATLNRKTGTFFNSSMPCFVCKEHKSIVLLSLGRLIDHDENNTVQNLPFDTLKQSMRMLAITKKPA